MTREACWRGRDCSLELGQLPRPPPQAHLAFEVRVFPRRERPLAPQRGSHPEGCRLFQAGPEGVESDISEDCGLASPRLGPRGSWHVQPPMVGPVSTLPAPFPIWERCQVFGWGFQMKLMPRNASGSRALGRCWESNSRAARVPDTPVLGTHQPFCCPPTSTAPPRKSPCSAHEVQPEGAGPGKASPPAWALPASALARRPPGCVMGAVLQPPFSRGVFIDELPRNSRPKRPRRV